MNQSISSIQWFGVSVRGPRHAYLKEPNQDAWSGRSGQNYSLIVVCDGLGSRSNSDIGAKAACRAVKEAVRYWVKIPDASTHHLLRLVKLFWEMRISPLDTKSCATTCLFACGFPSGRLIVACLGDGIAVVKCSTGSLIKVVERGENFLNHTLALGDYHKLDDWKLLDMPQFSIGDCVLLATDGIADDLIAEQIPQFVDWLISEFSFRNSRERYYALRKALIEWPTPKHQDDKSLALLFRTNSVQD
jgi:serine/threonine protein phosphatase PrpC